MRPAPMIGEPPDLLRLRDGRVVAVRPLEPSDRPLLAAAIRQLSDHSRYLRFAGAKPRMTERELDHLVDIDHHAHEALLAIDPLTARPAGPVWRGKGAAAVSSRIPRPARGLLAPASRGAPGPSR
jgi:hypothetical protein